MNLKKLSRALFSIGNYDYCHKYICILGCHFLYRKKKLKDINTYKNLPINNNKIMFKTTSGSYNCNPKYIAEEIFRRNLPYEIVWSVNKNILKFINSYPKNLKLVMENTREELKEIRTSKIIVDNERRYQYIENGIFKRKEQIYIQTFHGSMGFKKTGVDRQDHYKIEWASAIEDSKQIDYLTSNSEWETDFFKRLFFGYGKILKTGHPRNDILFRNNQEIKEKIYRYYNIPKNKKLVLYAPTLREDKDMSCYSLNYKQVEDALSEKFGGEWVLIAKLHPYMMDYENELSNNQTFINATEYPDIQELMAAADIVVSDYSSCLIDFSLTRRPAFIYATDIEKYNNERGLYYPLDTTPFPIASNNNDMLKNIVNFDNIKYEQEVEKFLNEKGCIEDGHASERVVDLIEKIMKEGKINA